MTILPTNAYITVFGCLRHRQKRVHNYMAFHPRVSSHEASLATCDPVAALSYSDTTANAVHAFFDAARDCRASDMPFAYEAGATDLLESAWSKFDGSLRLALADNTQRARADLHETEIGNALALCADPNVLSISVLIQALPILRSVTTSGAPGGLNILIALVRAGYRISGKEIDDVAAGFGVQLVRPITGDDWLLGGLPAGRILFQNP